jgi:hypothetical protein
LITASNVKFAATPGWIHCPTKSTCPDPNPPACHGASPPARQCYRTHPSCRRHDLLGILLPATPWQIHRHTIRYHPIHVTGRTTLDRTTTLFGNHTIPVDDLTHITFVSLSFSTQKNGVRGKVIGLGQPGNPALCPILTMARRIAHLRAA